MRGEFGLIDTYFKPLSKGVEASFGLTDDACVVAGEADMGRVLTLDTVVSGVHFLPDDPADLVARKALRVNLSDLAAMGAVPQGYLLSLALGGAHDETWVAGFAGGLETDQAIYGIHLYGGDTTRASDSTVVSITAMGGAPGNVVLRRTGARPGDKVFVTGTLGDSALGLDILNGAAPDSDELDAQHLTSRYRLPQPRVGVGAALRAKGVASAAVDISDGLVADLGHICACSEVGAEIQTRFLPLSAAAQRRLEADSQGLVRVLTGGDDYELAFTADAGHASEIAHIAEDLGVMITCIGDVRSGHGVVVRDPDGQPMDMDRQGWVHF